MVIKMNIPKAQEIYRHFKGNLYQIVTVAKHSETGELLVIYQALYGDFTVYARPLSMFTEKVDRVKYPQETQEYRFELQDPGSLPDTTLENRPDRKPGAEQEKTDADMDIRRAAEPGAGADHLRVGKPKADMDDRRAVEPGADADHRQAGTMDTVAPDEADIGEAQLDPLLLEYLDAGSYEERLNILSGLHHRVTDDMINVMAMATDVEVPAGDVETRYAQLRECLLKLQKYECSRLR